PATSVVSRRPIGPGTPSPATKQTKRPKGVEMPAVETMSRLNRAAAEVMRSVGVSAATDVTGFDLLGHLREMVEGSQVGARITASQVPLLPGTEELASRGVV